METCMFGTDAGALMESIEISPGVTAKTVLEPFYNFAQAMKKLNTDITANPPNIPATTETNVSALTNDVIRD